MVATWTRCGQAAQGTGMDHHTGRGGTAYRKDTDGTGQDRNGPEVDERCSGRGQDIDRMRKGEVQEGS